MNTFEIPAVDNSPRPRKWGIYKGASAEFKVHRLRELGPSPLLNEPGKIAEQWRQHVTSASWYNPDVEQFVVFMLNTRRKMIGFTLVATGTLDTLLVHPREVFKPAIVQAAGAIVVAHNHPSGDPSPSEQDIKVTRDLCRAGQLLKIELLDHVIMGRKDDGRVRDFVSLRELGYMAL